MLFYNADGGGGALMGQLHSAQKPKPIASNVLVFIHPDAKFVL